MVRWLVLMVLAVLPLSGCTTAPNSDDAGSAAVDGGRTGGADGTDLATTTAPASGSSYSAGPSCTGCSCPWQDGCGPPTVGPNPGVRFFLNESYSLGEPVPFRVVNDEPATMYYGTPIQQHIEIYTDAGRRLWSGSWSDYQGWKPIASNGTENLLTWDQRECLRDQGEWYAKSCAESRPMPAGIYHVRLLIYTRTGMGETFWAGDSFRLGDA